MTLRIFTAVVAVWAFAYLVGAFVAVDLNIAHWGVTLRFGLALCAVPASAIIILMITDRRL